MLRSLILNICSAKYIIMMIFCDKFFPLHFYKYQYWLQHSATKKNTSTTCNTRDTFMMIQITIYVQSSEPAFNALQFPNSFICHQLHVFTNHCINPTVLLQTAFLLRPSTPPSFPKKPILKRLPAWVQTHPPLQLGQPWAQTHHLF